MIDKSIHELRVIAQSLGVPDVFEKDISQLNQAIQLQTLTQTAPSHVVFVPETAPIETVQAPLEVTDALAPYIIQGLHVYYLPDSWHMQFGKKEDTGNLNMPVKDIVSCARKIMG